RPAHLRPPCQPASRTIAIGGYGSRLALRLAATTSDYAPKLFGEPATGTPPPVVTFITAKPRSLVPSARNRNSPSMPAKPDGLVKTSGENRCDPCVRASAATSATAS